MEAGRFGCTKPCLPGSGGAPRILTGFKSTLPSRHNDENQATLVLAKQEKENPFEEVHYGTVPVLSSF
jgi:hypothetical protein